MQIILLKNCPRKIPFMPRCVDANDAIWPPRTQEIFHEDYNLSTKIFSGGSIKDCGFDMNRGHIHCGRLPIHLSTNPSLVVSTQKKAGNPTGMHAFDSPDDQPNRCGERLID